MPRCPQFVPLFLSLGISKCWPSIGACYFPYVKKRNKTIHNTISTKLSSDYPTGLQLFTITYFVPKEPDLQSPKMAKVVFLYQSCKQCFSPEHKHREALYRALVHWPHKTGTFQTCSYCSHWKYLIVSMENTDGEDRAKNYLWIWRTQSSSGREGDLTRYFSSWEGQKCGWG